MTKQNAINQLEGMKTVLINHAEAIQMGIDALKESRQDEKKKPENKIDEYDFIKWLLS